MNELQAKIKKAKAELKGAGPIHARDLKKYIHRLEIELKKRAFKEV